MTEAMCMPKFCRVRIDPHEAIPLKPRDYVAAYVIPFLERLGYRSMLFGEKTDGAPLLGTDRPLRPEDSLRLFNNYAVTLEY